MCFHFKQSKSAQELQNRFNAKFVKAEDYHPATYNAFQYPETPIITNLQSDEIQLFNWGLIPHWAKDDAIRKSTLNARIETVREKPSFRDSVNNRCLILADGFYEWKWLDSAGKQKEKYEITLPDNELFAFAGLWSKWYNKSSNTQMCTYTILTTAANELMSEIHNTKKRMPVIVSAKNKLDWLTDGKLKIRNSSLVADIC